MLDVTVFGVGRFGALLNVEKHELTIKVPDCQVKAREMQGGTPVIPEVEYQVFEFQVGGHIYLVGVSGDRPNDDIITSHILHGNPKPRPYKTL